MRRVLTALGVALGAAVVVFGAEGAAAQVPDPSPDATLPGGALITQVLGWLKYASIAAAFGGLLIGGVATGVGHFGSSYSASGAGRKWVLGGVGAAMIAGLADAIVTTVYNANVTVRTVTKAVLAGVAVVAVSWQAVAAGRPGGTAPAVATEITAGPVEAAVGPRAVDGLGVPHGWRGDDAGALAAAVTAVRLSGEIATAGFITREDMIRSLATARYAPTLASVSAAELDELNATLGAAAVSPETLLWQEHPLTARVLPVEEGRARVEVWSVLVVAVPGIGAPRQAWRTVTVDLAWEAGDWKVDGWSADPGPTPLLDAVSEIAEIDGVTEVLSWPTAPGGGG